MPISTPTNDSSPLRICLISTNLEHWGGSEELWSSTAHYLLKQGQSVRAILSRPNAPHPILEKLGKQGLTITHLAASTTSRSQRLWNRLGPSRFSIPRGSLFKKALIQNRPNFALISMGGGLWEDMTPTSILRDLNIPYAVLIHQASEITCSTDPFIDVARNGLESAFAVFFVSKANQQLVRCQLGLPLANSEVVHNPIKVMSRPTLAWPAPPNSHFHLACPARLHLQCKGQDILIQVLAQQKWKKRPLAISLFGKGRYSKTLNYMAKYLGVTSIHQAGHTDSIEDIWKNHHACILPSRAEGLPLTLVEAMWYGRPAIVTDVGGNTEVIRDNVTGFVASTASVHALDEALERAWQRRHEWEEMGCLAAKEIRNLIPSNPVRTFADLLFKRFKQRAQLK